MKIEFDVNAVFSVPDPKLPPTQAEGGKLVVEMLAVTVGHHPSTDQQPVVGSMTLDLPEVNPLNPPELSDQFIVPADGRHFYLTFSDPKP